MGGPTTPGQPGGSPDGGAPWGAPRTPGGDNPFAPRPDGLPSPYTLENGDAVASASAWQLWWDFNQDRFLRHVHMNTGEVRTSGGDFSLGAGERDIKVGGRASAKQIQDVIVPALEKAIEVGGSNAYIRASMMALAKIGGEQNQATFDFLIKYFLNNGDESVNRAAAATLGVLGVEGNRAYLADIAFDNAAGRAALAKDEVPVGLRAYAAYGLGLLGAEIDDMSVRSRIVADLVQLLDEELDTNELQVAAMVALGLVPLEMDAEAVVCVCGGCKVSGPETNFQSQVTYLMRYFTADREFDPTVRAHTATTLGRLIAAAAEVAPEELLPPLDEIKGATAEFLIGALQKYARQPLVVQQSAVLALGLIGDADDQEVDQWIRHELKRAAGHSGDPLAKRFALMALAEVGAREGQGDQPWAGTQEVRSQLLQVLSRGKKSVKPWAGLALGVLGHELALASQPLDPSVDKALQRMTKLAKNADDLGAYALAAGLRRDRSAAPQLLSKLEKTKHDDARAYAAMGLGLMGAREAVEPLQAILADSEGSVRNRAGLALGMLGDVSVVERLIAELQDPDTTTEEKAALAQALGFIGDQRAVDALVRLAHDKETEGMMSVARDRAVLALGLLADAGTAAWRVRLAHGANYRAETESLTNAERTGVLDLH